MRLLFFISVDTIGRLNDMSERYTFSVIGGDCRQLAIIKELIQGGHRVKVFSLGVPTEGIVGAEIASSLDKAVSGADVILLPLPTSRDGKSVNLTSSSENIKLEDVFHAISKCEHRLIIGGLISDEIINNALSYGIDMIDYYKSEDLQQKNALPSAEGAIMVAMENTDSVLEGMNVLVCGYGRIGKILASKLKLLGASVSVAARKDAALCEIAMSGFSPIDSRKINQLTDASKEANVIFNTVPNLIFTRQIIENIDVDTLYIEIASSPGGIDLQSARSHGMRIIFAPSLPGKYAPASAGEYIFETIKDILDKRGMNI